MAQPPTMTDAEIDAFLAEPRDAALSYVVPSGRAITTPVWFRWADGVAHIQSPTTSVKTAALRRTGRASLCVHEQTVPTNRYVSVEGPAIEVPFDLDRDIGKAAVHYLGADAERFMEGIRGAVAAGRTWASFQLQPETIIARSARLF